MLIKLTAPTRVNLPANAIVDVTADEAYRLKAFGVGIDCKPEEPAASVKKAVKNGETDKPAVEKPKRAKKKA